MVYEKLRQQAVAVVAVFAATAANAESIRTFVTGTGSDAGRCTATAPCRTLQYAHDTMNDGGEIVVAGSGSFTPVAISKSISISAPPGVEASVVARVGGAAVTINASASVAIRGLTLEGGSGGAIGILSVAGGTLEISNCVARRFSKAGVQIVANGPSYFLIDDSTFLENQIGIDLESGAIGTISNSTVFGSQSSTASTGIVIANAPANNTINILKSIVANNYNGVTNSAGQLNIASTSLSNNNVDVMNYGTLFISGSSAQAGVANQGRVYTYGNNSIFNPLPGSVSQIPQR